MYNKILVVLIFAFAISCNTNNSIDVSDIKIESKLIRFDSMFYNSDDASFLKLRQSYPLMISSDVSNSVWLAKINNKEEREVFDKSVKVFGDFSKEYSNIISVFRHVKYYFPKFIEPDVYTVISNFDYKYPVLYSGKRLFVSLEMYLGSNCEFYSGFPTYLAANMQPERIDVDVAKSIIKNIVSKDPYDKSLLSEMIYHGKVLYLTKKTIPVKSEALVVGYTDKQIVWCNNNEREMWGYLVKNKAIYNVDPKLKQRFIDIAPFSKFYLQLDRESPGRVGTWLGLQIIESYMDNNDVTIEELVKNNNAKDIFRNSKYKPKK